MGWKFRLSLLAMLWMAAPLLASDHWSLKPRTQPKPPEIKSRWIRNPIDSFVLDRLQKAGLKPAPEADAATLIRRITYDLTGLPPTPQYAEDFLQSACNSIAQREWALEKLVGRLLGSPRYGERWGRHWLDVVRYAESEGFEYDRYRPGAWRYRDWVIKTFN